MILVYFVQDENNSIYPLFQVGSVSDRPKITGSRSSTLVNTQLISSCIMVEWAGGPGGGKPRVQREEGERGVQQHR